MRTKKILIILALLCTIAQGAWAQNYDVWDGVTKTRPWENPDDHVIHIMKASDLAYLTEKYALNEWNENRYWEELVSHSSGGKWHTTYQPAYERPISLDADIDMGDAVSWVPLGENNDVVSAYYQGTFYGNGHTIRIHISGGSSNYRGLFNGIASAGRVENLHVVADIHCSASRLVGGIAGENDGTIVNCWVSGLVRSDWQESSSAYTGKVGGIAGENNGTIQYCCVTANVQNHDADVGGLVGDNSDGTLRHCTFYGTRTSDHDQYDKYVGDKGTVDDLYDTYYDVHYTYASESGNSMYAYAYKHPFAVNLTNVGYGTVQVSAGGETGITRWHPDGTVTLTKTSGTVRQIDIKDADGNWVYSNGDINGTLNFTMPKKDVNITVYYDFADWPTEGAGTEGSPYLISSTDDWNKFAHNVNLGRSYSGKYVKLTQDISVWQFVGSDESTPFSGTFDGDGHTIDCRMEKGSDFVAPFPVTQNATFKNLTLTGYVNVVWNHSYLAGIVGHAMGNTTFTNCRVSTTLECKNADSRDISGGGFVGAANNVTFEGCVFDGRLIGPNAYNCGGFGGYVNSATVTNCLFNPSEVTFSTTGCNTFIRMSSGTPTITGCYYTQAYGTAQGTQCIPAASIPDNLGSPTAEYGMVTVYTKGILFDGTFYGGYFTFSLTDTGDNNATITGNDGNLASVTLQGRTLYRDGDWNTLCLPFNVILAGSPLVGAVARPLSSASISGSTLNLNFGDAVDELVAGTPYIIKWASDLVTGITAISGSKDWYYYLVDGKTNTNVGRAYLPWDCVFKTATPLSLNAYTLHPYEASESPDLRPTQWTLEAKANEGDAWTTIDSRDADANSADALPTSDVESQRFAIAGKKGPYQYFRFKVTKAGGPDFMQLRELKFYADIASPVFSGVTIDATDRSYDTNEDNNVTTDQRVRFQGTYDKKSFTEENRSILMMGAANTLYYPQSGASIGAQRAYFKIGEDNSQAPAAIRAFNINFGDDEATGIIEVKGANEVSGVNDNSWYSLDGRRLAGKPSARGIYVNNGRKIIIK